MIREKKRKKFPRFFPKKKKTKKQKVAHVHQRHPRNYSLWQEGRHEANKSRTKLHRSAANRQLQRKIVRRVGSTSTPPLLALLLPRIHPRTRWKKKIFVDTQPGSRNFSRHIDAGRRRLREGLEREESGEVREKRNVCGTVARTIPRIFQQTSPSLFLSFHSLSPPSFFLPSYPDCHPLDPACCGGWTLMQRMKFWRCLWWIIRWINSKVLLWNTCSG